MILIGCFIVWWFHIGRDGSEMLYENLCAGLMLIEFFFFGVHRDILFDIPVVACILLLIFSLRDVASIFWSFCIISLFSIQFPLT